MKYDCGREFEQHEPPSEDYEALRLVNNVAQLLPAPQWCLFGLYVVSVQWLLGAGLVPAARFCSKVDRYLSSKLCGTCVERCRSDAI